MRLALAVGREKSNESFIIWAKVIYLGYIKLELFSAGPQLKKYESYNWITNTLKKYYKKRIYT